MTTDTITTDAKPAKQARVGRHKLRNIASLDRILKKRKLARYEENEQEIRELLTEMRALWTKEATEKA